MERFIDEPADCLSLMEAYLPPVCMIFLFLFQCGCVMKVGCLIWPPTTGFPYGLNVNRLKTCLVKKTFQFCPGEMVRLV
jgi:hypothetical protein